MRLNKNIVMAGMAMLLLFGVASPMAEVTLELEKTEITGARELPKVLYIVPWKKTAPDSRPLPMKSLMDEVLSPIDIDVFRRQVRYHEFTHPAPEQEAAPK
jgi:hypothetical protein